MDMQNAKNILEQEKLRLISELGKHPARNIEADRTLSSFNKASEAASEQSETERQMKLFQRMNLQLAAVNHCLQKITNGTYGKCDDCGLPILEERLAALPWASRCLACKAKQSKSMSK
ncbi:MAG TPA: TraR/DksA C4-type zinc finger protein [Dehalococcoidales bacterium]|nr:TraR/DksA C4-type zinc finger protein [Dehalococcoidales bacterium]